MDCDENEFGIINANQIGISRHFTDSSEMAEVIADMINGDDNRYERWCENARKLALEYDFKRLTDKLIEIIEK